MGVSVVVQDAELFSRLKVTYDALQGTQGAKWEGDSEAVAMYGWSLQVPEDVSGQSTQRTLSLALTDGREALDVYVKLSLVSNTQGNPVSGYLGDEEWRIEFDIKKA